MSAIIFLTAIVCAAALVTAIIVYADTPRHRVHEIDSAGLIQVLKGKVNI